MEFTLAQAVFAIIGANLILIMSSIGLTITLYLHADKKLDSYAQNTDRRIEAIHQEMKQFHGKLCEIEERKRIAEAQNG